VTAAVDQLVEASRYFTKGLVLREAAVTANPNNTAGVSSWRAWL
jgi:hypothetical protein